MNFASFLVCPMTPGFVSESEAQLNTGFPDPVFLP